MYSTERRSTDLLRIEGILEDGVCELRLEGECDLSNVAELRRQYLAAAVAARRITIDLSRLEFIDSTGLRALIEAFEEARLNGRSISFRPGGETLMRVFQITGLDHTLPFE
jgi:anti-anti-sigma factor